jgi:uncharacterized protein YhfF
MNFSEEELNKMIKFSFGDSPELADELLALVLSGAKTATCSAKRDFSDSYPMPHVGRRDIALDSKKVPRCVIETTEVTIKRFDEVDEDFAVAEGEGPYEKWRREHEAYFERNGGFSEDLIVVCERFKVVCFL